MLLHALKKSGTITYYPYVGFRKIYYTKKLLFCFRYWYDCVNKSICNIYTIYNGIQQEQIIPFSRPDDTSGTKWLSKPHEGQQVPSPAFRGHTAPLWCWWLAYMGVVCHTISILSQLIDLNLKKCLGKLSFPRFNLERNLSYSFWSHSANC